MATVIRVFEEEDLVPLLDIWKAASKDLYHCRSSEEWNQLEQYTQDFIRWGVTFVCESDGMPVGFITLMENDLVLLFVSPAWQRQRVGAELLKFAQSRFDRLKLKVHKTNERAIGLYKRSGFRLVGRPLPDSFGCLQRVMWWRR